MNQTRSQSMYTDEQYGLNEPVLSMVDNNQRSHSEDINKQMLEIFMRQTFCYLRGNLN